MFERRSTLAHRAIMLAFALIFTGLCYFLARNARNWNPELGAVNSLFNMRGPRPVRSDFLIVEVNNQHPDRKLLDGKGAVSRSTLADMIRRVKAGGAKAVIVDIYMPERTTRAVDRNLWRAIANGPQNVFLPIKYLPDRSNVLDREDIRNLLFLEESVLTGTIRTFEEPPPGEFVFWKFQPPVSDFTHSAGGRVGGVGMAPDGYQGYDLDPDGVLRRIHLTYQTDIVYPPTVAASQLIKQGNVENVAVPSIVLPAVGWITEVKDKRMVVVDYGRTIRFLGDLNPPIHIPVDEDGQMMINYVGPPGTFPRVNAVDLLQGDVKGEQLKDKIVFIGITEGLLADGRPTPYSPGAPRVDITANAVGTVLDRAYLAQSTEDAFIPLGYLALFLALTLPFFTIPGVLLWTLISGLLYLVLSWVMIRAPYHSILPLVPALLLILLMGLAAIFVKAVLNRPASVYETV